MKTDGQASTTPSGLRVLISGASGMIGTELTRALRDTGNTVLTLVRRTAANDTEIGWDPATGSLQVGALAGVDAVINLSGASLSRLPWTSRYKRTIISSRVAATRTLTSAMRASGAPPAVLLNASAVGYYGDQPGRQLTEDSPAGQGFLTKVVKEWENAAWQTPESTRTVTLRTGIVLGPGGAMKPLIPLAKAGLAGPIGSARQIWPWISLRDETAAILHLLVSPLEGPVNLSAPTPASAGDIVRSLASRLHRPYALPLPKVAIELALGDAGRELLLSDQHVVPEKLQNDGFVFRDETVDRAMDALVDR